MTITKTQVPINMSILGELKLYDIFTGHNEIENKTSDFDNTQHNLKNTNSKLDACPSCLLSNTCQKCYKHFMYNNTFKTSKEVCSNYIYEMNFFLNNVLTIMEKNQNTIEKNNIKFKNLYNWRL